MDKWTYDGTYAVEQPELRRSWEPGETKETFEGDMVPYPGHATHEEAEPAPEETTEAPAIAVVGSEVRVAPPADVPVPAQEMPVAPAEETTT